MDVANPPTIEALLLSLGGLGIKHIDVLVHNAGGDIAADGGKADPNDAVHIKDEDVLSIMNNNLQSSILICQRVARVMIPQHEGRIVLVSSVAGLAVSPGGNQAMYAVAKAGGAFRYTPIWVSKISPSHSGTRNTGLIQY